MFGEGGVPTGYVIDRQRKRVRGWMTWPTLPVESVLAQMLGITHDENVYQALIRT